MWFPDENKYALSLNIGVLASGLIGFKKTMHQTRSYIIHGKLKIVYILVFFVTLYYVIPPSASK